MSEDLTFRSESELDKERSELVRPALYKLKDKKDIIGVEIGVQYGVNARDILEKYDIKLLYLVDPYTPFTDIYNKVWGTQGDYDNIFKIAKQYLRGYEDKIKWIRKKSSEVVGELPNNLDFVYIDGNHRYEAVKLYIELYLPKVKDDGILGGHDYVTLPDKVGAAVRDVAQKDVYICANDWWYK